MPILYCFKDSFLCIYKVGTNGMFLAFNRLSLTAVGDMVTMGVMVVKISVLTSG